MWAKMAKDWLFKSGGRKRNLKYEGKESDVPVKERDIWDFYDDIPKGQKMIWEGDDDIPVFLLIELGGEALKVLTEVI